ncbi:hypothetical protein [Arthrobacter sp. 92]|uniref:hypothetical protein n=1 Tax=Arthrobacter sp. 92 TaxID=3418175 RepID=UPI003D080518
MMTKQSSPSKSKDTRKPTVTWMEEPQAHDYPAAASYLSLIAGPKAVAKAVTALQGAPTMTFKAKDLLRAAGLPLLPADDPDVAKELGRVKARTTDPPGTISPGPPHDPRLRQARQRLPPAVR